MTAVYRAMQDCKAAVRYFKMSAQNMGNPYGIDTSKIVLSGQGSGGLGSISLCNYRFTCRNSIA